MLDHLGWYRALTLEERAAALRGSSGSLLTPLQPAEYTPRWSEPAFEQPTTHADRLAVLGITDAEFQRLVHEPIEIVSRRIDQPPPWLTDLVVAFSQERVSEPLPLADHSRHPLAGLLNPVHPLIVNGVNTLRSGVATLEQARAATPFDTSTIADLFVPALASQLVRIMSRTMALEVNVMRLQGRLRGETPEDRFAEFTEGLRRPERMMAFWQEYPVLARVAGTCIHHWTSASLELIQRLSADWALLRETFSAGRDPGVLVRLTGDSGDPHRDGRSVRVLEFSSGLRIVYKPKAIALAAHFQEVLHWVNTHHSGIGFRTVQVLDRGSYGWMEFVAAAPCTSRQDVERFYQRQGGYLALLHAIAAIDFHLENVIAAGGHPVLIDLEALFHPSRAAHQPEADDDPAAAWADEESVLSVGMLPLRVYSEDTSGGIDVSGWGGTPGQVTPFAIPVWHGSATDRMHLERQQVSFKGSRNRPSLAGADVELADFVDDIVAGFTAIYSVLMANRAELALPDGLLARFSADVSRIILRPTKTYSTLLDESFHPDLMRDAVDRDLHFDRLWFAVDRGHVPASAVAAEHRALRNGDIPFFTTQPGSVHLWPRPDERIDGFFPEPGLATADRRLQSFSPDDLERQVWMIRAAVATSRSTTDRQPSTRRLPVTARPGPSSCELIAAACRIGDRLEQLAIRRRGHVNWMGVGAAGEGLDVRPLGLDLYDGLPGVALFLAYLGALSGDERYVALSKSACATLRRALTEVQSELTWVGGFVGWGGVIYALTHLGALWRESALLDEAGEFIMRLPALIQQDEQLDIINGSAGCLGTLLASEAVRPAHSTLAAAMACGDRLIEKAQRDGDGWCWPLPAHGPFVGFAHGAAGISWALCELFVRTREERFITAARAGFHYERGVLSAEDEHRRSLRDAGHSNSSVTWCHGASGIGLSRLAGLPYLDEDSRADVEAALRTTVSSFGHNHSLCHGDFGNLELLLQSGNAWRDKANRIAGAILERARGDAWRCGTSMEIESPGLMTGLAGIGYGLLRVADPVRVPCVLLLQGPGRTLSTLARSPSSLV